MSILLPGGLPVTDRYGNDIYTDYRNMMRFEIICAGDDPDENILAHGLVLLYGPVLPRALTPAQALEELVYFYSRGASLLESSPAQSKTNKQIYDYEEDGGCIAASFLYAYGIDLTTTNMHWWKFFSLFENLPPDTIISQKMYYRALDTSKMKGAQKKEAERLKKLYALKKKGTSNKRRKTLKERLDARYAEIKNNGI